MAKKQVRKQGKARTIAANAHWSVQRPPKALLDEVQRLFAKHDWSGNLVGRPLAAIGSTTCPPGTTPHEITYQLPDGTWVTKTVCLPNSSMGAVSLPGEPGVQDDFIEPCKAPSHGESEAEPLYEAGLAGDSGKEDP